jgi:flagellar biosynthetic protein FliR
MFEIYKFGEAEIILFALIFMRVSTMLVTMPVIGGRSIPNIAKVLLSFSVSLVLIPFVKTTGPQSLSWKADLLILFGREALVGLFMGFLARVMFMTVEIAGQILSFSMGLSAAQLVNPNFGESSSVMEQFETVLGTLIFLVINGHHMFFEALYRSFQLAPVGLLTLNVGTLGSVTTMAQDAFSIAIKLAGPMIAVILFLNVALGIVGRAVPQINVFVISFPVNILVGLFIFMVSIPLLLTVMESDFVVLGRLIMTYVRNL